MSIYLDEPTKFVCKQDFLAGMKFIKGEVYELYESYIGNYYGYSYVADGHTHIMNVGELEEFFYSEQTSKRIIRIKQIM